MQIIKVPGINGASVGCARAGNAIIEALGEIEINEAGKAVDKQVLDIEEIHLDNSNLRLTNKLIYENSFEAYGLKHRVFFLGGDHSISYSLFKGFRRYCEEDGREACLVVFDSRPNLKKGNGDFPKNEEWLRQIVDEGFRGENVLLVGVRHHSLEEMKFLKEKKIRVMNLNSLETDIEDACDTIMEFSSGKELYLSLDVGVYDSAFVPASTFHDAGGLSPRQLIYIFQRMNKMRNLRAIDLVEVNSEKDKDFGMKTVKLCAKILAEFL